jgi:hypothetical protein
MSIPSKGPNQATSPNQLISTLQTSSATKSNILNSDIAVTKVNIAGSNGAPQTPTYNQMMGVNAFVNV